MVLSIWYSHNHKCFKTRIGYIPWNANIEYVNGFNEELIAILPLIYQKKSKKEIVIQILEKTINRLKYGKKKKVIYIKRNHRQWWK